MVILKLVISGLISVILTVLSIAFSSRVSLFPFLRSQFSELWQLVMATGFPGGSDNKAPVCNAGDPGSKPGLERSPGEENSSPLQYSCLENPMDFPMEEGGTNVGKKIEMFFKLLGMYSEKAMAAHSSTLAWKIPWTEELGRLQSMRSLRVGHN